MAGENLNFHGKSYEALLESAISVTPRKIGHAFGVDPSRPQHYSLRQSRYFALARQIEYFVQSSFTMNDIVKLLDIGVGTGVTQRYVPSQYSNKIIIFDGADLNDPESPRYGMWRKIYYGDFTYGYPEIASETYDIVVCEQVLEHIHDLTEPVKALSRIVKPGGIVLLGVPIFPRGINHLRQPAIKVADFFKKEPKQRGHVQSFSKASIVKLLAENTDLILRDVKGFRIVSGGILRPLEDQKWWWKMNMKIGKVIPGLCIEIQLTLQKPY